MEVIFIKIVEEHWVNTEGFNFTEPSNTKLPQWLRYCMVQMDRMGYIPSDWEYNPDDGSIRHLDGDSFEKSKFVPYNEFDDDGDWGIVECGKCGELLPRCEAFLSDSHLYLCSDCEEVEA